MIFELCLLLLTTYVFIHYFRPRGKLPPGPRGLPFLGCFPVVIKLKDIVELKKKYGNVFIRTTGAVNFVYVCDYKLCKESLSREEFSSRPEWKLQVPEWDGIGLHDRNALHYFHSRRFFVRHLRELGMGKSKLEGLIMREAEELVEDFKKLTKEPSKLPFSINIAIINTIWQLLASQRYDFNDNFVEKFFLTLTHMRKSFDFVRLADLYPIIDYIIPEPFVAKLIGKQDSHKMKKEFEDIMQPFIDHHLKTLDPNNPRDFIDEYLIEMDKQNHSEEFSFFSVSDLLKASFDLFIAGSGATTNVIRWFIIYMASFPDIQKKIQLEIDRVVSGDRLPGLQHRNELALLDATLNEVQRHSTQVVGFFRYTTTDVELGGYHIPKKTVIVPMACMSHIDPTHFKDPDKFDPSRFLDENGKYIPSSDGFMPFGLGKRQCIGENFARMELFLFAAALLQNFTFSPPDEETDLKSEAEEILFTRRPRIEQKLSIKYRK